MWTRRVLTFLVCLFAGIARVASANSIAAGSSHTVINTADGHVWVFGANGNCQLGDGTTTTRKTPVEVPSLTGVVAVAAGSLHTLALKSDGSVWAWGYSGYGQIGDGTNTQRCSPVIVPNVSNVIAIAAGDNHSLALTSGGTIYAWGMNTSGQLGDGTTTNRNSAITVGTLTSVTAIGAGANHSLAVKSDGTAWAWGSNSNGQLGDGSTPSGTARTSAVQMTGVTSASAIAGGAAFSLILKSDGTLVATGQNFTGQIGDTTTTQRTSAVAVSNLTGITAISAGQASSYALKNDGTVWAWGTNSSGRLGDGTTTQRNTAVQATGLSDITQLAGGGTYALAVSSTGIVYTWGANANANLGDGTNNDRSTPTAISDASYAWKLGTPVFNVAAGTYFTERTVTVTCVTSGVEIHYTLDGSTPALSDATVANGGTIQIDQTKTLKARAFLTNYPTSEVASATYTLAVAFITMTPGPSIYTTPRTVSMSTSSPGVTIRYTTDGSTPSEASTVYASPVSVATTTTLKAVGFRTGWTSSAVAGGAYTMNFGTLTAPQFSQPAGTYTSQVTVALTAMAGATIRYTTNGSNVQWNSPIYTDPIDVTTTTTIRAQAFHPDYTTSAQASAAYTIVVATPVFSPTAGAYDAGQLITVSSATSGATVRYTLTGLTPTSSDPIVPAGGIVIGNFTLKAVAFKTGATTSGVATASYTVNGTLTTPQVAMGDAHGLAIRADGVFWAWGSNGNGQLGDGTMSTRALPVIVSGLTGATALAAGGGFSLAVKNDGTAWAWGANGSGQLGDGTTTQRTQPTAVANLTAVIKVAAGVGHGLALKSDGTLWSWGTNSSSQLGDGTTTQRTSPVQASGLSSITGMAGGSQFSLAVQSDGIAWSWGANSNGQLGTGNTTSRSTPGPVSGITTATQVAAGSFFGMALLSDGTVQSWGHNGSGQLGDGTTTQRTSPVAVSGLSGITAIAAGATHGLALSSSGVVAAWGGNANGQLGDGTTTQRTTPVTVPGLPTIAAIAAGNNQSLAVGTDGSVWAWGLNSSSQLGDGTTMQRTSPVQIADAGMVWKMPAPALSVASGPYTASFTVAVTESDAGAVVHYTTNGTSPTEADTVVASGGTVSVGVSTTLKARAWKPGAVASEVTSATYELKVTAPSLSPGTNSYASAQSVTMSTTTPGANITYTTDATEPTSSSTAYSSAITVSDTRTIKARAFKTGWTDSPATPASYWISSGTVATPTIAPAGGSVTQMLLVTLACSTSGSTMRYTVDGTTPTIASPTYAFPFLVSQTTTVNAKAFKAGATESAVASSTYSFDVAGQTGLPTIAPAGGRFAAATTITITGPVGATLRYTTNGVDPTDTDTEVPGSGQLTVDRAEILKVRAWLAGSTPSAVQRADFLVTGTVAGGILHSLGLDTSGTVWGWGVSNFGQVGDGTLVTRTAPVSVLTGVVGIAAGWYHSLAVKADGTVWAWGSNNSGQIGDGTGSQRSSPVQVPGLTNVIAVAAGNTHSLALTSDGTVWAWGGNLDGQLGTGNFTQSFVPVPVPGLTGASAIAAGENFSLALQPNGAAGGFIWAWGKNSSGQLGDGSTTTRTQPVQVTGVTTAAEISAGQSFAIARLTNGTVIGWGLNDFAQLGNQSGTASNVPVAVPTLVDIAAIAAGRYHGLAIDHEGRVWGWGQEEGGQLGVTPEPSWSGLGLPPSVVRLTPPAFRVAGGYLHTIVLGVDGILWGSGTNAGTGLGTGTYFQFAAIPSFTLAPNNTMLATDADGDGLFAWEEFLAGTDPLVFDTNGNGLSDLVDVRRHSQSVNPDDDGDGVPNAIEVSRGTDPFNADTDGDSVSDLLDDYPLDPTRTTKPTPNPSDATAPTITLIRPTNATLLSPSGLVHIPAPAGLPPMRNF